MARTKEEREALKAELEQEEREEAERAKGGGGRSLNVHADWADLTDSQRRKAWPELFEGDDDKGDDGGDDDKGKGKGGKGKGKKKDEDDDDEDKGDRVPRRGRGYFQPKDED